MMARIGGFNLIPATTRIDYTGEWHNGGRTFARMLTHGERRDAYIVLDCARPLGVIEGEAGDWFFRKFEAPAAGIMQGKEIPLSAHCRSGKTRRDAMVAGGLL